MKSKPYFKIVDWIVPGAEVIAIAHDGSGMERPHHSVEPEEAIAMTRYSSMGD